tara:strand:+ start:26 stop:679 length:654 start_codon:yes stop_codon:yes gene_type:complete
MAEGKKSFVAYCDWIEIFEELEDNEAGKLAKHLFRYVNDLDPESDSREVKLCFIAIKQSLKRDLKKYDKYIDKQKVNGAKGGRPKKTQITQPFIKKPKKADSVSDSVSVNEIIDKSITYTKNDFLIDWNVLRLKHLNKPSFLNTLRGEDLDNFTELTKDYSQDDFKNALVGLFKQKKLPNDQTSMQSNPKHFVKFFNTYLTAYHDKNTNLYGKQKDD